MGRGVNVGVGYIMDNSFYYKAVYFYGRGEDVSDNYKGASIGALIFSVGFQYL